MNTPIALGAKNQVLPGGKGVKDGKYTWSYELDYYRKYSSAFYFVYLGAALPMCWLAKHIELKTETLGMTIVLLIFGGLSVTIGYHRLWSHRSFEANSGLRCLLAIFGAGQSQWSIMWWAHHHRAHHLYTDTDRDPYNARRGFFFSHIGWMLGPNQESWGPVDLSDLKNDPIVIWQQRYYLPLALASGALLPTAIAYYGWNDWKGGLLYGGFLRVAVVLQSSFLINSVAHSSWAGTQPYSNHTTARNVPLLRVWTLGEGNHNFHHTFPSDYRNGVLWYEHDVSRWVILGLSKIGLVSGLKTTSNEDIERARLMQSECEPLKPHLNATDVSSLPQIDWHTYINQVNQGRPWICIDQIVHDVTKFMHDHPGGRAIIQQAIGLDGTALFYGQHANSLHAKKILESLRVGRISGHKDENTILRKSE